MKALSITTLSILGLSIPALAQTEAAPDAAPVQKALIVRTADISIANMMAMQLDPTAEVPELGDGQQYALTMSSDRSVKVTTMAKQQGFLHATVYPPVLMTMFKPMIDAQWGNIQGFAMMGLTQSGMSGKEAAKLMKSVREFPNQLASLDVRFNQNPNFGPKGLKINFAARGAANSWLAETFQMLKADPKGAPTVPAGKHHMAVRMAIADEGLRRMIKPFMELSATMGAQGNEELQKMMRDNMNNSSGIGAVWGSFDGSGIFATVFSTKAMEMAKLISSEAYQKMLEEAGATAPGMEMEIKPKAFSHRDTDVIRFAMSIPAPPNPLMPDGQLIMHQAAIGNYWMMDVGGKPDGIKKLIDMAADQKVTRQPLPAGRLMDANLRIADLMTALNGFNPMENAPGGSPELMTMQFDNQQGVMSLTIELK